MYFKPFAAGLKTCSHYKEMINFWVDGYVKYSSLVQFGYDTVYAYFKNITDMHASKAQDAPPNRVSVSHVTEE